MKIKQVLVWVTAGLLLVVLLQNAQPATFKIIFWEVTMPQIVLLLLTALLGIGLGYFMGERRNRS